MTQEDRLTMMCAWNGVIVFFSVLFLTGAFFKSALIAIFVLVSCLLGFGQRWLFRAGFAASILAIAVLLGLIPHPDQWRDLLRDVRAFLEYRTNVVNSTAAAPEFTPFRPVARSDPATDSDELGRQ